VKHLRSKPNDVGNSSTADLVRVCVNDPGQAGLKIDDIRSRMRLLDAVEKAGDGPFISFEDADAKTVQKCVGGMSWRVVRADLVEFCDAVANMPDKPPGE
jgi:hypothetical protein